MVTVIAVLAGELVEPVELVELEDTVPAGLLTTPERNTPDTTKPWLDTDATRPTPAAKEGLAGTERAGPAGRDGGGAPWRRDAPNPPLAPDPPAADPPAPDPPAAPDPPPAPGRTPPHPPPTAGVMVTARADNEVADTRVPTAVTQSPTATAPAPTVWVRLKRVDAVQLTVTSPMLGPCTCIEGGVRAATVPDVPGTRLGPDRGVAVVEVVAAPAPEVVGPPHAATAKGRAAAASNAAARVVLFTSSLSHSLRRASMGARRAARVAG